jgi:UDPglucose 6-dehydrogenase/UDP-N-acetyl-D-galactosamine dehydrogenase
MVPEPVKKSTVCIVGLGYVGCPLADAFSHHVPTIGFDIDRARVDFIRHKKSRILATIDSSRIKEADYILICVPTPVLKNKQPDLAPVRSAAKTSGKNLKKGATVVLESTVYPGVTEDIVRPILESESGFQCGRDFRIGYSPERINPGDKHHGLSAITKIVAGMDAATLQDLANLYGLVTHVYSAKNIRTAEAAKVIENIQRDLNIALMNELSIIFHRIGIETGDVLEAAGTKWNFLKFRPCLVGGHCIPVDPYYLVMCAQEAGYHSQVILAGRSINDSLPKYVAELTIKALNSVGKVIKRSKVLIMGLTYKENVPDIRESPAKEMVNELKEYGVEVYGYDPLLAPAAISKFGAIPVTDLEMNADGVIVAVAHDAFKKMQVGDVRNIMGDRPVLIDVRSMIKRADAEREGMYYECL